MKRHLIFWSLLVGLSIVASAQAQNPTPGLTAQQKQRLHQLGAQVMETQNLNQLDTNEKALKAAVLELREQLKKLRSLHTNSGPKPPGGNRQAQRTLSLDTAEHEAGLRLGYLKRKRAQWLNRPSAPPPAQSFKAQNQKPSLGQKSRKDTLNQRLIELEAEVQTMLTLPANQKLNALETLIQDLDIQPRTPSIDFTPTLIGPSKSSSTQVP